MVFVLLAYCLFLLTASCSSKASCPKSDRQLQLLENRGQLCPPEPVSKVTAMKLQFARIKQTLTSVRCGVLRHRMLNYSLAKNVSTGSLIENLELIKIAQVRFFFFVRRPEERSRLCSGGLDTQVGPGMHANRAGELRSARAALLNFNESLCCRGAPLCPFIRTARKELIGQKMEGQGELTSH